MSTLLKKEFRLALHPAALIFLSLAVMMIIPNYPLTVTFFYPCLGAFFICQTGRENQDILYTALLPVEKRKVVRARIAMVALLQAGQIVLCVPFLFLRTLLPAEIQTNAVGLGANLALLGVGLAQMGLFDLVFFTRYYRDPAKVGVPFLLGTLVMFLWMCCWEALPHFVPFVRDRLDTPLFQCVPEKLAAFGLGAAIFLGCLALADRICEPRFEKLDL